MKQIFLTLACAGILRAYQPEPLIYTVPLGHCESGSWFTTDSDPDSVTVRCEGNGELEPPSAALSAPAPAVRSAGIVDSDRSSRHSRRENAAPSRILDTFVASLGRL